MKWAVAVDGVTGASATVEWLRGYGLVDCEVYSPYTARSQYEIADGPAEVPADVAKRLAADGFVVTQTLYEQPSKSVSYNLVERRRPFHDWRESTR